MKPENSIASFEDQTPKELVNGSFIPWRKNRFPFSVGTKKATAW